MSSEIAIRVRGLSKCFQVYRTPFDRLRQWCGAPLRRLLARPPSQYFREAWALRDISFDIRKGETVGIVGGNGSGKSTLLQLVCETLAPTTGLVETQGRIAALLELGSGFNPEFTGRENVYLNGQILGLSRAEINSRFDEIVRFAGIGEYLDRPVKTYSSGMYVRLAFAVQACIDPDILIVDEALAVGDVGFQYKCFKRMEALRARGTTILMVTHSSSVILEHADRCLVLDGGRLVADTTDVLAAVMAYEKGMIFRQDDGPREEEARAEEPGVPTHEALVARQRREVRSELHEKRFGSARAIIAGLEIRKGNGERLQHGPVVHSGETLTFLFDVLACESIGDVVLGVSLSRALGGDVWGDNNLAAGHPLHLRPGRQTITYQVSLPLNSGDYLLHCGLATFQGDTREELDQRRPASVLKFWSARELGGVLHAPITVASGS